MADKEETAQDFDPVMDSINEAVEALDLEQPEEADTSEDAPEEKAPAKGKK